MNLHGSSIAGLMMLDLTVGLVLVDPFFWVFLFIFLLVDKLSLEPLKGLLDLTCRRRSRGHSAYTDRTSDSVCDTVASLRQLKPMQHKQRKLT